MIVENSIKDTQLTKYIHYTLHYQPILYIIKLYQFGFIYPIVFGYILNSRLRLLCYLINE